MRNALVVAVVLVVAAGCGDSFGPESFDWAARADLPIPRADFVAVALNGKIYALGGFSGSTLARVDEYDPATNTWTRKADMLTPRRRFAAGVVNGKIYVSAGMSWTDPNGLTYISSTEEYDPGTNTWTNKAAVPLSAPTNGVLGNSFHAGGVADGRLHVFEFNTTINNGFTATHVYDPGMNTWTRGAPVPFSYVEYSATEADGGMYVMASGGRFAHYDPSQNVWVIRRSLDNVRVIRRSTTTVPVPSIVSASGAVFAVGAAVSDQEATSNLWRYDVAGDAWSQAGRLGQARYLPATVFLNGSVYVLGGASTPDPFTMQPLASVEVGTPR